MPELVESYTSFALIAHHVPEIPGGAKKTSRTFAGVIRSVIDRFLKFLHCYIQR